MLIKWYILWIYNLCWTYFNFPEKRLFFCFWVKNFRIDLFAQRLFWWIPAVEIERKFVRKMNFEECRCLLDSLDAEQMFASMQGSNEIFQNIHWFLLLSLFFFHKTSSAVYGEESTDFFSTTELSFAVFKLLLSFSWIIIMPLFCRATWYDLCVFVIHYFRDWSACLIPKKS